MKIQSVCSISIISKQIKALPKTIETNQLTASLLVKHIPHDKKKEKDISEKQLFEYVRISFMFYAFSRNLHLLDFQHANLLFVENFLKFKLQTNDDRTIFPGQKHSRSPEPRKKVCKSFKKSTTNKRTAFETPKIHNDNNISYLQILLSVQQVLERNNSFFAEACSCTDCL